MHLPTAFRHWFCTALGAALVVAGGFGFAYSIRVSCALVKYHRIKHGFFQECGPLERPPMRDAAEVLPLAQETLGRYPHNYYMAVYAAQVALDDALALLDNPELGRRRFKSAEHFADLAYSINPYNGEVIECKRLILEQKGDLDAAIRFWIDHAVEREFWNPHNHEVLARLYLRNGNYSKAAAERRWIGDKSLKKRLGAIESHNKSPDR